MNAAYDLHVPELRRSPGEEAGRALSDDELRALWTCAEREGYPSGPLLHLLVLTGCRRMEIAAHISFYAGAEDCDNGKPAPDGYLKAAKFLQADVSECLVFEDSIPGIQAARNAGMQVVAVTHGSHNVEQVSGMADMAIRDYSELDDHFFEHIKSE